MNGCHEYITCSPVNGIRQDHARALRHWKNWPHQFGIVNWNYVQTLFASSIEPYRYSWVGEAGPIRHKEQEAIGG
jgi:hypothetical protein